MIKKYFEYIGFSKNEYPYAREKYKDSSTIEIAGQYLSYLDKLRQAHSERTQTIETKNSQIIGQSSIVISIISLFIPIFAEHFSQLNIYFKLYLVLIFVLLLLHFILAINHAIKLLLIDKNRYMFGSTSTISSEKRPQTTLAFLNEEISDLIKSINFNASATNKMASNLVYASRCFRLGIWYFSVLTMSVLLSITVLEKSPQNMSISNIKDLTEISSRSYQLRQLGLVREIKQLRAVVDSLRRNSKKERHSEIISSAKK